MIDDKKGSDGTRQWIRHDLNGAINSLHTAIHRVRSTRVRGEQDEEAGLLETTLREAMDKIYDIRSTYTPT